MDLDLWPIVGRAQLVQTFRPGESGSKEAPYRTLRSHGWATPGVSIVTRSAHRATGRLTIFSVLNVAAARSAREGDHRTARALAQAAGRVERSKAFAQLRKELGGKPLDVVSAAVDGTINDATAPALLALLRDVARATRLARGRSSRAPEPRLVAGRIREAQADTVLLEGEAGAATLVPRWLAESAHRDAVGDLLALVSDRLDETQMVVKAVPAISLDARADWRATPYGRTAPVRAVTASDARLLSRRPAPLRVVVPVSIER